MLEWGLGILGIILVNVFIWVFFWGKRVGRTNTRLTEVEDKLDNPQILPQCTELFTEIKEKLAKLDGKVGTLLLWAQEDKKNNEKQKTQGR